MAKAKVTVMISLLGSTRAIEKGITEFHTKAQALQAELHMLACSVLKHVGTHRDTRIVLKLMNAVPEMARKNALKDWFGEFSVVSFDGEECILNPEGKTRLGDAMATPFWKFSPEKPYQPMDVYAAIEALKKRLATDASKTGTDHSGFINGLDGLLSASKKASAESAGLNA